MRDSLRQCAKETNADNAIRHKRLASSKTFTYCDNNLTRYGIDSKGELVELHCNKDSASLADTEFAAATHSSEYRTFQRRDEAAQELLIQRLAASKELMHLSAIEQRKRAAAMYKMLMVQSGLATPKKEKKAKVYDTVQPAPVKRNADTASYYALLDKMQRVKLPSSLDSDIPVTRRNVRQGASDSVTTRCVAMPDKYRVGGTMHNVKVDDSEATYNRLRNNMAQRTRCDASNFES
jgi:hypothetical protein